MSGIQTELTLVERADRLQREYVRTLDNIDLVRWPALFAREASYVVNSRENIDLGLGLALILDDSRDRIEDRLLYITKVWEGHYNEYWPRHILGPGAPVRVEADEVEIETPFAIYMSEPGEVGSRLLAVGCYRDVVVVEDDEARFASKLVVLDTTVLPRYFVYPL